MSKRKGVRSGALLLAVGCLWSAAPARADMFSAEPPREKRQTTPQQKAAEQKFSAGLRSLFFVPFYPFKILEGHPIEAVGCTVGLAVTGVFNLVTAPWPTPGSDLMNGPCQFFTIM